MKEKIQSDYEKFRDMVLEEEKKGNVVLSTPFGFMSANLEEFINQPTQGLLYDLNRDTTTILTFIEDRKWVNDYAVMQVITALKNKVEKDINSEVERRISERMPTDVKHIVEFKLKYLWERYRVFERVDNKAVMHEFSCKINILEDILESIEE